MLLEGNKYQENSKNVRFHEKKKQKYQHRIRVKPEPNDSDFKLYAFICIVFLIGIILGCIYFRVAIRKDGVMADIMEKFSVLDDFVSITNLVLVQSMMKNLKILIVFWIVGVSVVGAPFLLLLCMYKGFKISFTISALLTKFGFFAGNAFIFQKLFLHSTLTLLAMVILTASSIKVSINVFKNKKDIKLEMVRHSMLAILGALFLFVATFLETFTIL